MAIGSRRRNGVKASQPNAHTDPTEEGREPCDRPDGTPQLPQGDPNDRFIDAMRQFQNEANMISLGNAQLANQKALADAKAKFIRGAGEGIKEASPR